MGIYPEKIEGESKLAYQSFCAYCDMGAGRSLRALHKQFVQQKLNGSLAKHPTQNTIDLYSHKNRWQERVAQFDLAVIKGKEEALQKSWEERQIETRELDYATGRRLREKADKIMANWDTFIKQRRKRIKGENGEPDQIIQTLELPADLMLKTIKLASDLERAAAGIPDQHDITSGGKPLGPIVYLPAVPPLEDAEDDMDTSDESKQ